MVSIEQDNVSTKQRLGRSETGKVQNKINKSDNGTAKRKKRLPITSVCSNCKAWVTHRIFSENSKRSFIFGIISNKSLQLLQAEERYATCSELQHKTRMKDELDLSEIDLDALIDVAILSHGFMPYKRDYFFHIETMWKDNFAGQYLVVFKHCYSLSYQTLANEEVLKQSWDECFIDFEQWEKTGEPEGYVWGTNWSNAYPGFSNLKDSEKAAKWTNELGKEMKELLVESEIFKINLIYHNWTIEKLNKKTDLVTQSFFPLK